MLKVSLRVNIFIGISIQLLHCVPCTCSLTVLTRCRHTVPTLVDCVNVVIAVIAVVVAAVYWFAIQHVEPGSLIYATRRRLSFVARSSAARVVVLV